MRYYNTIFIQIEALAFISFCLSVQGRKALASTGVHEFNSMVIGQHVYKCVWTPLTNKSISVSMQEENKCDEYTVND